MKRQGSGWRNESRRHSLARKGVKTIIDPEKRLAVNNYVARGYGDENSKLGKLLTDKEHLWETISQKKLEELMSNPNIEILSMGRDYNNFGEFLFITMQFKGDNKYFTFYGFGFHECRNRWIDTFTWYSGYDTHPDRWKHIPKMNAIEEYEKDRDYFNKSKEADIKRYGTPKPNKKFEELADMTDEDFAYSELMM